MTTRARRHFAKPLVFTLAAIALGGCISTHAGSDGLYSTPIGDAPVTSNQTPYSRGLECLASYNASKPAPRIAVGQIADYTGKMEADGGGRKITQGAALMAISALSKAGVRLVERYDTSVAELELKYANNKLIGDAQPQDGYRKIFAGSIAGSDYYLVGGITELNYNIHSTGDDAYWAGTNAKAAANADAKTYVMNVGLDLRLVNTRTLEVVDVISFQKQIVGRELQAGVFDMLGQHIFDIGGGDSALEPIQLAVRAVVERAVLEMMSQLYNVGPKVCHDKDPLASADDPQPMPMNRSAAVQPQPQPAQGSTQPQQKVAQADTHPQLQQKSQQAPQGKKEEHRHDKARKDPYRWYSASNTGDAGGLRGGID